MPLIEGDSSFDFIVFLLRWPKMEAKESLYHQTLCCVTHRLWSTAEKASVTTILGSPLGSKKISSFREGYTKSL